MEQTRFDEIADSYESAISRFPYARTDERWLLEHAHILPSDKILEIAGGTGYLTQKLVEKVPQGEIVVQDISDKVLQINASKLGSNGKIRYYVEDDMGFPELEDNYFDKAISLGGFHHIEDQVRFMRGVHKKLKEGGLFCIGDFADNSPVQRYFDEVIHKLTSTGHTGLFMSESRMVNLGRFAGFSSTDVEIIRVPFYFANEEEIGKFFQMVHALNQEPRETYKDIETYFTLEQGNGKIAVMMDYIYAKYVKQEKTIPGNIT